MESSSRVPQSSASSSNVHFHVPSPPPNEISLNHITQHLPRLRIPGRVVTGTSGKSDSIPAMHHIHKPIDNLSVSSIESSPFLPSSVKARSCDVYIGYPNSKPDIIRFAKWLRAELKLEGVSCFAADRSKCKNVVERSTAERALHSATFGMVIVTHKSFSNPHSMEELKFFIHSKNLVPIFFGLSPPDCMANDIIERRGLLWEKHGGNLWMFYGGQEEEWKHVVNVLSSIGGWKLVVPRDNWRSCICEAILLLGMKLGKRNLVERAKRWKERVKEELPFPRNDKFVGREKELLELELRLFGDVNRDENVANGSSSNTKVEDHRGKSISKGKEPVTWVESFEEIEVDSRTSLQRVQMIKDIGRVGRAKKPTNVVYGLGIACISGDQGIGKTELLLEFCYRIAQRYKMVLWVSGEARYIRQSLLDILPILEVDLSADTQIYLNKQRTFEELEKEAIRRVRKELMRDIPFLVVIDNLEREKDWWDAQNIMELLPRFGGETHVLLSTCLPSIMNLKSLKLSHLSGVESIALMKGRGNSMQPGEADAFRILEERVGRVTFGLALIGGVLSEIPISPIGLIDAIDRMSGRDVNGLEDQFFRRNPFLTRLVELCFVILDEHDELSSKLALASGWFAPSPIPLSLLVLTSFISFKTHHRANLWKKCVSTLTCRCCNSRKKRSIEKSLTILMNLGLARNATKVGCVHFHDIIRMYARKRGGIGVTYGMVHAINYRGSLPQHSEHIWAACFLLFNFGADPSIFHPETSELVSFIKRLALPLAISTFTDFSRCTAALELLRLCTNALEGIEETVLSQIEDNVEKSVCWATSHASSELLHPSIYKDFALLKATLIETRAKLMLQGGDYDIGEQLYRKAVSIREVFYGWDHLETSANNTMGYLVRSKVRNSPILQESIADLPSSFKDCRLRCDTICRYLYIIHVSFAVLDSGNGFLVITG